MSVVQNSAGLAERAFVLLVEGLEKKASWGSRQCSCSQCSGIATHKSKISGVSSIAARIYSVY